MALEARCETCRYWSRSLDVQGICMIRPPVVFQCGARQDVVGLRPPTYADHWCGEFQPCNGPIEGQPFTRAFYFPSEVDHETEV